MISILSLSTILQAAARHHQAGQFQQAEKFCLQACAITPNQPDALHLLAVIHAQTGRHELANEYFTKAIASDPLRADFHGNYANALWEQGCIEKAIITCQRALELNANRAETYNILGNILLSQNRLEEAVTCFRSALKLHPNYPHALNNLGNTLQKMNKADESVSFYQEAINLQENYPEAHNNLGKALKSLGKINEARHHFLTALKLRPAFHKAARNCAEVDPVWLEPLDGKRLHLRRYCAEDAAYLYQCYKNMTFMSQYNHYIPRHQHLEDLAAKLRQSHNMHPCQSKSIDWIIINKNTQQPAGIANLVEIQFLHQRAEFLIGLPNPTDHASGIGLEATLLGLDFVFNRARLNKLTAVVYGGNVSSQKNSLAIGFVQESYLREQIFDPVSGKFLNLYGNGMTVSDFRTNPRIRKLSQRLLGRDITRQLS